MFEEKPKDLVKHLINRVEDIGRVRQMLDMVLAQELFYELSKHDQFWKSGNEIEGEKLDSIRRQLCMIHESLSDMSQVLEPWED